MPHLTPPNPKFKAIKLVIFDWSGVISDDRRPVHAADGIVLKKYGIKNRDFDAWLADTKASASEYFAYLGVKGDPVVLKKEYEEALTQTRINGLHPVLYPVARETLQALEQAQKITAVISKHPTIHLHREAHEYGIAAFFSEIIGDIHDKASTLQKVLQDTGIHPDHACYVGDMTFDVLAARQAGVIAVGVPTGYQTKDVLAAEKPDVMLEKLSDILKYV